MKADVTGTATPAPTVSLDLTSVSWVLGILFVTVLLVGLVLVWNSWVARKKTGVTSVVRSWIALALVIGLLAFTGLAFAIADSSLRSTLAGALAAAVGSAVAFYFSSKATDQVAAIANGQQLAVPDVVGKTTAEAQTILGSSFALVQNYSATATSDSVITSQQPLAGSTAPANSAVTVTLAP